MGNRQAVYSVYSVPRTTYPAGTLLLALDRVIDEVGDFNRGGNNSDHAGRDRDAAEAAVHLFHFADVEFVHTGVRWLPPPSGTYQAQGLFQGNNRCRRCYCPMIVIKGYRIPNTHFEQKTNFIPLDVHIYIG